MSGGRLNQAIKSCSTNGERRWDGAGGSRWKRLFPIAGRGLCSRANLPKLAFKHAARFDHFCWQFDNSVGEFINDVYHAAFLFGRATPGMSNHAVIFLPQLDEVL